jgi:hypothetical protein
MRRDRLARRVLREPSGMSIAPGAGTGAVATRICQSPLVQARHSREHVYAEPSREIRDIGES